jgi:hypothetical protein
MKGATIAAPRSSIVSEHLAWQLFLFGVFIQPELVMCFIVEI